ncbi:MAG: ParB/RepB/Spo0J family partition protein [Phycisphaerales bacterium]|jgi:ParB family chromosome partitioning protein|nr:ParB/RepB/Spo0J family partition protein [Phycisphaerales bacterium]
MAAKKTATKKKGAAKKKRRLGMGLSGMIGSPVEVRPPTAVAAATGVETPLVPGAAGLVGVPVDEVRPNLRQPRHAADSSNLEPLVTSIRAAGVMQPIVVRPKGDDGLHELVAGERRWRAARLAGLSAVPAVIHDIDDRTAAEWAIIENVQREDLDAIERGDAFRALQDDFGLTHSEIAEQVGLTRAAVTNQIRLCDLDEGVRTLIRHGALSGGHGRSLLGVADVDHRIAVARQAIEGEWSVRELERRVRALEGTADPTSRAKPTTATGRAHLDDLERQLGEHLGTKVRIQTGRKRDRGRLIIEFYDLEQFDGVLSRLQFKSG